MNVSITIGAVTVCLTEKGYDRLRSRMDSLLTSVSESMRELVSADAEKRLAEYFSEKSASGKTIFSEEDVDDAFTELGFGDVKVDNLDFESEGAPDVDKSESSNTEAGDDQNASAAKASDKSKGPGGKSSFWLSKSQVVIGGVCGGIAEKYDIDVVWVRLAFVLASLFLFQPWLIVLYLILWVILPVNNSSVEEDVVLNGANKDGGGCFRGCFIVLVFAVLAIVVLFTPLLLLSLLANCLSSWVFGIS